MLFRVCVGIALIAAGLGLGLALAAPAAQKAPTQVLDFAGHQWAVRSGSGGPGPNLWDDNNASVDGTGALHLKLTHVGPEWHCVELTTGERLGFGTYTFDVSGPLAQLDPNVVLGLFNYPPPDVGADGTNEIDIEFARWGAPANPNGNYTIWPAQAGLQPASHTFEFTPTAITTTHQFAWTSSYVAYRSAQGSAADQSPADQQWTYQPVEFMQLIPQHAMPLHINLWLFQGAPPVNGQELEIIISNFVFTPYPRVYLPLLRK